MGKHEILHGCMCWNSLILFASSIMFAILMITSFFQHDSDTTCIKIEAITNASILNYTYGTSSLTQATKWAIIAVLIASGCTLGCCILFSIDEDGDDEWEEDGMMWSAFAATRISVYLLTVTILAISSTESYRLAGWECMSSDCPDEVCVEIYNYNYNSTYTYTSNYTSNYTYICATVENSCTDTQSRWLELSKQIALPVIIFCGVELAIILISYGKEGCKKYLSRDVPASGTVPTSELTLTTI